MKDAGIESAQFEPTVFGAVRRYRTMFILLTIAIAVAAVGYTVHSGK